MSQRHDDRERDTGLGRPRSRRLLRAVSLLTLGVAVLVARAPVACAATLDLLEGHQLRVRSPATATQASVKAVIGPDPALATVNSPACPATSWLALRNSSGDERRILLECSLWRQSGMRWRYQEPARGITRILAGAGRLTLALKGGVFGQDPLVGPAGAVEIEFGVGTTAACARFDELTDDAPERITARGPTLPCHGHLPVGCGGELSPMPVWSWDPIESTDARLHEPWRFSQAWPATMDGVAAAAHLAGQPVGHRALLFASSSTEFSHNAADVCVSPGGDPKAYACPWLDHGVTWLAGEIGTFLDQFTQAGGEAELLLMDIETPWNNWAISGASSTASHDWWDAIEADPRYALDLAPALGFTTPLYETVAQWNNGTGAYLVWNALLHERVSADQHAAVFDTAVARLGPLVASNWDAAYWSPAFAVPDYNGHDHHSVGGGAIVGTHQAGEAYGRIGYLRDSLFAERTDAQLPFASFLLATNQIREMPLAASTPFHVWIARRSWPGDPGNVVPWLRNSDYWQETLFHTALAGASAFLYWNPWDQEADTTALIRALDEIDQAQGCSERVGLVQGRSSWKQPWVATGARLGADEVWRITLDLAPGERALDRLITAVPLSLDLGQNRKVVFPAGRLVDDGDPASALGVWVTQPAGSPPPAES